MPASLALVAAALSIGVGLANSASAAAVEGPCAAGVCGSSAPSCGAMQQAAGGPPYAWRGAEMGGGSLTLLALGFAAGCLCTALLAVLLSAAWLRRQLRQELEQRGAAESAALAAPAPGPCKACPSRNALEQPPVPALAVRSLSSADYSDASRASNCSTDSQLATSNAFANALCPQWEGVTVPREAISLCLQKGKLVKLGRGASGEVYRGVLHGTTPCAVKVFDFNSESSAEARWFIQEAALLWRLNHPNIVQFLGVAQAEGQGLLLMELMRRGDLGSALNTDAPGGGRLLGWYNRGKRIALDIAAGLVYLHRQRIVHLDLKPGNVMLSGDLTAKIGDVGFSRIMRRDCLSSLGERLGTFNYCAPEVLLGEPATESADIYSFGVLLWQLCTGEPPVRGARRPVAVPLECPEAVSDLLARCTSQDPAMRPTAAEVVAVLQAAPAAQAAAAPAAAATGKPPASRRSAASALRASAALHAALAAKPADAGSGAAADSPLEYAQALLDGTDVAPPSPTPAALPPRPPPHVASHSRLSDAPIPASPFVLDAAYMAGGAAGSPSADVGGRSADPLLVSSCGTPSISEEDGNCPSPQMSWEL